MYNNKIVCAIKHNNKPLTENKDTVFLPFNTEYSIYLKNMSNDIAYISVYVNGRDVNPNKKIRLFPKCTATIEKFQDSNHRFIFKERTKELQEVRINQDEDSLIRLEICFELGAQINPIQTGFLGTNPLETFGNILKCSSKEENMGSSLNDFQEYNHVIPDESITRGIPQSNSIQSNSLNSKIFKSTAINKSILKKGFEREPSEEKSYNSGFTAPGRKKEESDNITFYESYRNSSLNNLSNEFSFIIKLAESEEPLLKKEIKKNCPTCKKKFKAKYFYCPFDGTFLD